MGKKIIYLIGAGATQAVLNYIGGEKKNLLMKNNDEFGEGVCSRIIKKAKCLKKLNIPRYDSDEIDIEKLISLFENSGAEKYRIAAEELRTLYYHDIVKILLESEILKNPRLAIGLLEMHKYIKPEVEELVGIINLNHDNLFHKASQKVFKGVNIGFNFISKSFEFNQNAPLIIKLHGSFNWIKSLPIKIIRLSKVRKDSKEILWIPPTILKESKNYPFNKLIGIAFEILSKKCDILRIIGCSLSQNDWNIVSLLFNAQYMQILFEGICFKIELIMDKDSCNRIIQECSYLQNIFPIQHLKDGDFDEYKKEKQDQGKEVKNPFSYWLKTKAQYHKEKGDIDWDKKMIELKRIEER